MIIKLIDKELKIGDKGFDVDYLKHDLNYILGTKLRLNGIFDEKTQNAVKKFQKKVGLPETGVYDYQTFIQMRGYFYAD